jgi:hypothetical protein
MSERDSICASAEKLEVEYRDIPGCLGYRAGSDGTIWSCRVRGGGRLNRLSNDWQERKQARTLKSGRWYRLVCLTINGKKTSRWVHRLVLEAFVGPRPMGMQCRHYPDPDGENNRIENLSWGTAQDNSDDKRECGRFVFGEAAGKAKLTEAQVLEIRRLAASGMNNCALGRQFNVHHTTASNIVLGKAWKHLTNGISVAPKRLPDAIKVE